MTLQVVPLILDKAGLCLRVTPCMYINFITWHLLIKLYKIQLPIRRRGLPLYFKQEMRRDLVSFKSCFPKQEVSTECKGGTGIQSSSLIENQNCLDPIALFSAKNKPLISPEGIKKGAYSMKGLTSAFQRIWIKSCDCNKIHPVVQRCHVPAFH